MWPVACLLLAAVLTLASGCTGQQGGNTGKAWELGSDGKLTLRIPSPDITATVTGEEGNTTTSRLVLHTSTGEVYGLLVAPPHPVAAIVHAPGAGVKKEDHLSRARQYAQSGYAYLVLDIRGQGGETAGYPLNPARDYERFLRGDEPQVYSITGDMIQAGRYLKDRFGVPVIVSGESNGGRYAALAAAHDPLFAGFIGVSTSGFGRAGDEYSGDARRFLLSIDPLTSVGAIAPGFSWVYHAPGDTIIPFSEGEALFQAAGEPKRFISFNGTHGVNGEADADILLHMAQIYAVKG